ncbi:MAG: hypothetical protein AAF986_09750 [Pseudomonadota bacterium]
MRCAVAGLIALGMALPTGSVAQSLSPMKSDVVTFGDKGSVRVHLRNPYVSARRFNMDVFDVHWRPVENVILSSRNLSLAPGASTSVFVVAPLDGERSREFYVCATSRAYRGGGAGVKGQVCGKYRLIRYTY